ncbi:MAG: HlyD family secretion protein [bacterium]|nr:HlyD family secretion protein [bacterium]
MPQTKRWIWIGIGVALLLAGTLLGYRPLVFYLNHVVTDNANVQGVLVTTSSSAPGRLAEILVEEGDSVSQGQRIARFHDDTLLAELQRAEAARTYASSLLAEAQINLELEGERAGPLAMRDQADLIASKARLSMAQAALEKTDSDLKRVQHLSESGLVSSSELGASHTLNRTRRAELEAALEAVHHAEATRKLTNGHQGALRIRRQQVETARAELQLAEADMATARIRLQQTHLESPVRGIVARVAARPGERLDAGQTVCLIRDLDELHLVANVSETEIRKVHKGQAVLISVDAYPGVTFHGQVLTVGSVTGSQFALIPQESIGGNFVKVIQHVPIRISVADPGALLKVGLSAVVSIDTRKTEQSIVR